MKLCLNCEKELAGNDQKKYCSKSCAAIKNNSLFVKRIKKTKPCFTCEKEIDLTRKYCIDCRNKGKHFKYGKLVEEQTLIDTSYRSNIQSNKYRAVRQHSHVVMKNEPKICVRCGYDKHVEVCHIKPVHSFSDTEILSVINAKSNLLLLCPNCHWEFDHLKV